MSGYNYNGITYYQSKYHYGNFCVCYETYEHEGRGFAVIEDCNHEKDISFQADTKRKAANKLKKWFRDLVSTRSVKRYMSRGYRIYADFEDVLMSVKDIPIGYHITDASYRESILAKGLLPNGTKCEDVWRASQVIDSIRPFWVPGWVTKSEAIYAHPLIENARLAEKDYYGTAKKEDTDSNGLDLYVINLDVTRCWMGSMALSGFSLFDKEMSVEDIKRHTENIIKDYGKTYWKYSCSLSSYLGDSEEAKKADKRFGLDEILICHSVPPKDIVLIGYWDKNYEFQQTDQFKNYVKEDFKDNYQKILDEYNL